MRQHVKYEVCPSKRRNVEGHGHRAVLTSRPHVGPKNPKNTRAASVAFAYDTRVCVLRHPSPCDGSNLTRRTPDVMLRDSSASTCLLRVLAGGLPLIACALCAGCGDPEAGSTGADAGPRDSGTDGADGHNPLPDVALDANKWEVGIEDGPDASDDGPTEASPDAGGDGGEAGADGAADGAVDAADADPPDGWVDGGALVQRPACYHGDFDTDTVHQLACLAFPGPVRAVVNASVLDDATIASATFAPDAGQIAMTIRDAPDGPVRLVVVDLEDIAKSRELLTAPAPDRVVSDVAYSADGNWLGFLADFEHPGTLGLYVVPLSGGFARRVSPAATPGRDVTGFAWSAGSPGASWLAYVGDLDTAGVHGLWTVDVAKPAPLAQPILTDAQLGDDADVQRDLTWDDEGRVLFRSNHGPSGAIALYRARHDATELEALAGDGLANGAGAATVASFGVAPDGMRVAFSANSPDARVYEVFVLDLTTVPGSPVRVSDVGAIAAPGVLSGPAFDSPVTWSPDGTRIAVVADWRLEASDRDDAFSAFLLPAAGSAGGWRVLGAPQSFGLNARDVLFADDGKSLVVRGDLVDNGVFELYVIDDPSLVDQDPLAVRFEEVPAQGDVVGVVQER